MTRDLLIDPLDGFLFRDGRPFSAGDDHRAEGVFPPLPTTFYGALRGTILAQHGARFVPGGYRLDGPHADEVRRVVGAPTTDPGTGRGHVPDGALALRLVGLADPDGRLLLPLPADVLRRKGTGGPGQPPARWAVARPAPLPAGAFSDAPTPQVPRHLHREDEYVEHPRSALLPPDAAEHYLRTGSLPLDADGCAPRLYPDHPSDRRRRFPYAPPPGLAPGDHALRPGPALDDPRTHVSVDPASSTAAEGRLFTVGYRRLRPGLSFAVRADDAGPLDPTGDLRLGGEARPATCRPTALTLPAPDGVAEAIARAGGRARLVLSSPAPFAAGWRPDGVRPDLSGALGGCPLALVAAAIPGYRLVGGWDAARARPRTARRAAVAGSVYYVRLDRPDDAHALVEALHGRSLCADPADARRGLGTAWVGACPLTP